MIKTIKNIKIIQSRTKKKKTFRTNSSVLNSSKLTKILLPTLLREQKHSRVLNSFNFTKFIFPTLLIIQRQRFKFNLLILFNMTARSPVRTRNFQHSSGESNVSFHHGSSTQKLNPEIPLVCFANNSEKNFIPDTIECGICKVQNKPSDLPHIQCCDCLKLFDIKCAKITTTTFFGLAALNRVIWFCAECSEPDVLKNYNQRFNELGSRLASVLQNFSSTLAQHDTRLVNNEMSIAICHNHNEDLENKVEKMNNTIVKLEAQLLDLKNQRNSNTTVAHKNLDKKITWVDKLMHSNNIIMRNVPSKASENLYELIISLSKHLELNDMRAIDFVAHRIKSTRNNGPAPILIKFNCVNTKNLLFGRYLDKIKANKPIMLSNIGHSKVSSRVYLNHHLSATNSKILFRARELVRKKEIAKAFSSYGSVYIKLIGEGQPKKKIESIEHLSTLVNKHHSTN